MEWRVARTVEEAMFLTEAGVIEPREIKLLNGKVIKKLTEKGSDERLICSGLSVENVNTWIPWECQH